MRSHFELRLNVWSVASRHVDIHQTTSRIGRLLTDHLPIGRLLVRRLDAERGVVETVGAFETDDTPAPERVSLSETQCRRVVRWLRRGEPALRPAGSTRGTGQHATMLVLPERIASDALIVPLISEHNTMGILLLETREGQTFRSPHRRMAAMLSAPFAVALENDRRFHELNALREAAEAEKRSLLRRLGRDRLVEEIIGADGGLMSVMQRVDLVSRADAPVLILGETGSGKEVIARAIHDRSPRAAGPFVRVNCGAIPPDLIDSELFGHEPGAFTGATSLRRGWFERADAGTLFLDEIGELPPAAQVRLLRIVQEGLFERVGGEKTVKVDVRILAATHRDLSVMVQTGRFREDLWYRVAVFPVILPALRERTQDIPDLAVHFATRAAKRFGLPLQMPTDADVRILQAYDWPGNVRELASVIDRAAILGNGDGLEVARALGTTSLGASPLGATSVPPVAAADRGSPPAIESLDAATRRHIEQALAHTHGRIEGRRGAAEILGVNPHTLRARMRKLGIDWSRFRP